MRIATIDGDVRSPPFATPESCSSPKTGPTPLRSRTASRMASYPSEFPWTIRECVRMRCGSCSLSGMRLHGATNGTSSFRPLVRVRGQETEYPHELRVRRKRCLPSMYGALKRGGHSWGSAVRCYLYGITCRHDVPHDFVRTPKY